MRAEGFAAQLHNLADERLCYDALQPVRLTFKSVVKRPEGGMNRKPAFVILSPKQAGLASLQWNSRSVHDAGVQVGA